MSVSEHVRSVINSCAQTIHVIRILRSRGMDDAQLQLIYRAVVIAKLTYASSSWWGFTSASDRQRLEGFLHRGRRYGLYPADQPTIVHILHPLLPKQIDYCCSLRRRSHNFELTHNHDDRNFIDRMLFRNPCSLA